MALYLLSYDLVKRRDYEKLWAELERFGALRVLESDWCLKHGDTSCEALRDHFRQFIDDDDRLFVSEVSDWASWKAINSPNKLP